MERSESLVLEMLSLKAGTQEMIESCIDVSGFQGESLARSAYLGVVSTLTVYQAIRIDYR